MVQILPDHNIVQITFEINGNHNSSKKQCDADDGNCRLDGMSFDSCCERHNGLKMLLFDWNRIVADQIMVEDESAEAVVDFVEGDTGRFGA